MLARETEGGRKGGGVLAGRSIRVQGGYTWGNAAANGGKGISEGRSEMERTIARQLVERAKEGKEQDRGESRRHKRQKLPSVYARFLRHKTANKGR